MKRFCIQTALFAIPFFILVMVEVALPTSTFTYRPWEALQFKNKLPYFGPFYPSQDLTMDSEGDLNHHTTDAKKRNERWVTDVLGFRNDSYIPDPDILLIGDSFVAGVRLDQEETITAQLQARINSARDHTDQKEIKVYNMAPGSLKMFDRFLRNGILKKPKILIYAKVERTRFPSLDSPGSSDYLDYNLTSTLRGIEKEVLLDRVQRVYSLRWIAARLLGRHGNGKAGKMDGSMYFRTLAKPRDRKMKDILDDAAIVMHYKKYCDSLGIGFIFIPMPDKETLYYDLIPLQSQPRYLLQLDSVLNKLAVPTINTLAVYNNERMRSSRLLYHADDSHWNAFAVSIIADQIIKHEVTRKYRTGAAAGTNVE